MIEAEEDFRRGLEVSLSDGFIDSAGAPGNDVYGHVEVYRRRLFTENDVGNYNYQDRTRDETSNDPIIITTYENDEWLQPEVGIYYWTQLGNDIDGEAEEDYRQCIIK